MIKWYTECQADFNFIFNPKRFFSVSLSWPYLMIESTKIDDKVVFTHFYAYTPSKMLSTFFRC